MPKTKKIKKKSFLIKNRRSLAIAILLVLLITMLVFIASFFAKADSYADNTGNEENNRAQVSGIIGDESSFSESDIAILEEIFSKLENLEKRVADLEKVPAVEDESPEMIETVVPINQKIYIVQPRDYLYEIARKVYGTSSRWYDLVNLNRVRYPSLANPPHELKIGWELRY